MKIALVTAAMTLALAFSAHAVELRTPVTKQLFTCVTSGVSRVAALVDAVPAPCCEGQLKCAQFLSTTGIVKPRLDPRT